MVATLLKACAFVYVTAPLVTARVLQVMALQVAVLHVWLVAEQVTAAEGRYPGEHLNAHVAPEAV